MLAVVQSQLQIQSLLDALLSLNTDAGLYLDEKQCRGDGIDKIHSGRYSNRILVPKTDTATS